MELNEIFSVLLAVIVLAFTVSLAKLNFDTFILAALFFIIIFIVNITAKKLTAYYMQASVETKIWQFQRYGIYERSYFKYPIPIGIILPFLVSVFSLGSFFWLAATQSEIKASKARVIKKHDFYSFSEMTEFHIGVIPAAGIFACLVLAFIAYLINQPELGKLSIYFAAFNMIPLGNLDGTKIFFGSIILWFILAAVTLIALGYALLLI